MRLISLFAVLATVGIAEAQPKSPKGEIKLDVPTGGVAMVNVAVPDAIPLGGAADTRGVTEATTGTVTRALTLASYFNLIDRGAFLVDPKAEGMDPAYKAWFNVGAQG